MTPEQARHAVSFRRYTRSGKFIICPVCHKDTYRYPSQIKKSYRYCSKKCWHSAMPQRLATDSEYRNKIVSSLNKNRLKRNYKDKSVLNKISKSMKIAHKEGRLSPWPIKYGADNPAWKGGVTEAYRKIRTSKAYAKWRLQVFKRDNFTCRICFKRGGILEADHIKPFSKYPELRLSLDNGRTLCHDCHTETDTHTYKLTTRNRLGQFANG